MAWSRRQVLVVLAVVLAAALMQNASANNDSQAVESEVDGNEIATEESVVSSKTENIHIIPGFSAIGRRALFKYGDDGDDAECAMSYSAIGEHMEAWTFTIRRSPWSWTCIIEAPPGSKLKFTFYSITFSGGGSAPILSGAEVWGPQGVLSRDEHFVLPQGRQLRNAAGWVSGLTKVSLSRIRGPVEADGAEARLEGLSKRQRREMEALEANKRRWKRNAQIAGERARRSEADARTLGGHTKQGPPQSSPSTAHGTGEL